MCLLELVSGIQYHGYNVIDITALDHQKQDRVY